MKLVSQRGIGVLMLLLCLVSRTTAWEWSNVWTVNAPPQENFLSIQEVSDMRVREIKRRLARTHGYSAEELAKMLDKKELIQALAYQEEKVRLRYEADVKRTVLKQSIIVAVIAVLVVLCWPLIQQGYEICSVNVVVYTDQKRHQFSRCWELQSYAGLLGIALLLFVDILQLWLTLSILGSWVMRRNKYFFPAPNLSVRPAQLMGGNNNSPMANYGINLGPMVITWALRFVHGKLEAWTGRALANAQRAQQKAQRANETPDERAVRRKARKEAKRQAQERADAIAAAAFVATAAQTNNNGMAPSWMEPVALNNEHAQPVAASHAHQEFLEEMDTYGVSSELDNLD